MAERDVSQAGPSFKPEEPVDARMTQVEIRQHDPPSSESGGERKICSGRGSAFAVDRAGHHERDRVAIDAGEVDVRAQDPERLGVGVVRLAQHHELVVRAHTLRRLAQPAEQRRADDVADLLDSAEARVEGVAHEGEQDAADHPECGAERDVAHRSRLRLHSRSGGSDEERFGPDERLLGEQVA